MGRFVVAAIILNGAWTQLDVIGWPVFLLPLLLIALDHGHGHDAPQLISPPVKTASLLPVLIAALLCALHLAHVVLTVREEFGFGGDEGYHLSATRAFALYFLKAGPYLAGAAIVFAVCRRWTPRIAAAAGLTALIVASTFLPNEPLFGRYPTAFYLLSMPLNVAFDAAAIPYPFSANHIVNMLSLPAWLFVLRPAIVKRWPDWRVLPVALLIYFQGPSIVYVSGGLLEPWAFVFVLLAIETAVVPDDRPWLALLLAGIATTFKETTILFIPPIWLLTMVEWHGWRPSLRDGAIRVAVAATAPFVVYYAVRRGLNISRGYDVAASTGVWSLARASEWLSKAQFQLGIGGMAVVAAITSWSVIGTAINRAAVRQHAVWIATALALAIFFAADAASIPYTGYGRFLAYSLLALCGVVFATTQWLERGRRSTIVTMTLLIAALQAGPTLSILALDFQGDYQRNSLEWPQSLVRYPIRSLSQRLAEIPGGDMVSKLRVAAINTDLISLRVAYPDLAERYDIKGENWSPADPACACQNQGEAVIAVFEWPAHFADATGATETFTQIQTPCLTQLRATCASVALEKHPDGAIIGALGAGLR